MVAHILILVNKFRVSLIQNLGFEMSQSGFQWRFTSRIVIIAVDSVGQLVTVALHGAELGTTLKHAGLLFNELGLVDEGNQHDGFPRERLAVKVDTEI